MKIESVRRALALTGCLCIFSLSSLSACNLNWQNEYPILETQSAPSNDGGNEPQNTTEAGISGEDVTLSLAVPFGQDAAEALRLLFLARQSGLLTQESGQYIGQQLQIDDLQQFDGPLHFQLEAVSADTGASADQVSVWRAAGTLPDLIYTENAAASIGLDRLLDLNDLLYDQSLLSATHIYPAALDCVRRGQILYGVPYLASVPLVYYNEALLTQYQIPTPGINWTWPEWLSTIQAMQQAVSKASRGATPADLAAVIDQPDIQAALLQQAIFMMESPVDFLPFLPASLSANAGWSMWNGYDFSLADPAFHTAIDWLRQQAAAGYSWLHLSAEQQQTALSNMNARLQNRIVFWVGDSTDLAYWHQQTGLSVSESLIPAGPLQVSAEQQPSAGTESILNKRTPIQVRSLVVSKTTRYPRLAARLAAFFALDVDALLLQSRFQLYEGLFPLVQEPAAWTAMVERQPYGHVLAAVQANLPYAYCSGQQVVSVWQSVMQSAIVKQGEIYMTTADEQALPQILQNILSEAQAIMQED
ncbi:MAG: extracellular solute-binding protein [Clostridiaceae bacterium]|nr:extracellular solute-binding protein [Clostridiaceae bacterium]